MLYNAISEIARHAPVHTLWSDQEIIDVLVACAQIDCDPSLRVNSDGSPVRGIGFWEEGQLSIRDMIRRRLAVDQHADWLDRNVEVRKPRY